MGLVALERLLTGQDIDLSLERLDNQGWVAARRAYINGTSIERLLMEIQLARTMAESGDWRLLADAIYLARAVNMGANLMRRAIESAETRVTESQDVIATEVRRYLRDVPESDNDLISAGIKNVEEVTALTNLATEHSVSLKGVVLSGADLRKLSLQRPDLSGVIMLGVDLSEVDFSGADLTSANLSRANMFKISLAGAELKDAILTAAALNKGVLTGADLSGANLKEADLSEADLTEAILKGADLSEANLTGSRLFRADLSRAVVTKEQLGQVESIEEANLP